MTPEQERQMFERYFARLDERRMREPYDASWQAEVVASVEKVADAHLQGSVIQHVQCASTLCRIQARHTDITANAAFMQRFHINLGAALPQATIYSSPDKLTSFAYLSRKGETLPSP
jgi:hypothetical protein